MNNFRERVARLYEKDLLDRIPFAEALYNLITKEQTPVLQDNKSLVIALDASWGSGKTCFLELFSNTLEELNKTETKKFTVIKYNAWKNDDFDEPLLSILYNLIREQKEKEANKKAIIDKGVKILEKTVVPILLDVIKNKTGFDAHKAYQIAKDVDGIEKNCTFKKYEEALDKREELTKAMEKLATPNSKVVMLIDELDRCRPTYAIELLETIKHYLNVENYIFIFALDKNQLSHSIKTQYGEGMDSGGYLRRFFDYVFNFPVPSIFNFCSSLLAEIDMHPMKKNELVDGIEKLSISMKLSCRDINIILNSFIIVWETVLNSQTINHYMMEAYIFLIAIKYKYTEYYNAIIEGNENYFLKNTPELDKNSLSIAMSNCNSILHRIIKLRHIAPDSKSSSSHREFNRLFKISYTADYVHEDGDKKEYNEPNLYFGYDDSASGLQYYMKLLFLNIESLYKIGQHLSQQLEMINIEQEQ